MLLTFPIDEKTKARFENVCRTLNITPQEWFDAALRDSEFDVLVRTMDRQEQNIWTWDEKQGQFVLGNKAE